MGDKEKAAPVEKPGLLRRLGSGIAGFAKRNPIALTLATGGSIALAAVFPPLGVPAAIVLGGLATYSIGANIKDKIDARRDKSSAKKQEKPVEGKSEKKQVEQEASRGKNEAKSTLKVETKSPQSYSRVNKPRDLSRSSLPKEWDTGAGFPAGTNKSSGSHLDARYLRDPERVTFGRKASVGSDQSQSAVKKSESRNVSSSSKGSSDIPPPLPPRTPHLSSNLSSSSKLSSDTPPPLPPRPPHLFSNVDNQRSIESADDKYLYRNAPGHITAPPIPDRAAPDKPTRGNFTDKLNQESRSGRSPGRT